MTEARYSAVAIILHWLLAVLLIGMVFYGWYMEGLLEDAQSGGGTSLTEVQTAYNMHKTTGIIVLVLSLIRLGWRFTHPVPALPEGMKPWEKTVAHGTHMVFYAIMIGMPVGGWMASSAAPFPSYLFNNPELTLPRLPVPQTEAFADTMGSAHGAGGWVILILFGLHAAAALKHQFLNRDNLLGRMIPFLKG